MGRDGVNTTVHLVRRAKDGDPEALEQLVDRYYDLWLAKYHGKLGHAVRKLYDTEALVQSAVGDAIEGLPKLQNEAVFFTWVTAIIRHKLAKRHDRLRRERPLRDCCASSLAQKTDDKMPRPEEVVEQKDGYLHTLRVMSKLFPESPGEMAALYLRCLEDLEVSEIAERLGRSDRTVYRWLHDGAHRLHQHLKSSDGGGPPPPS